MIAIVPMCVVAVIMVATSASSIQTASHPQDQRPPTVRGVALGASEETLVSTLKLPRGSCYGKGDSRVCWYYGAIGSVPTKDTYLLSSKDGVRFAYTAFSTTDYRFIRGVFFEKFGEPTSIVTAPYKNAMGATYNFETVTWVGSAMVIMLDQYSAAVSDGAFQKGVATFKTRERFDADIAKAEAQKKKALSDF